MQCRRRYREDTTRMQGEIEALKSEARVFQDMKCTNCGGTLDLPAVHFMCGHSYHEVRLRRFLHLLCGQMASATLAMPQQLWSREVAAAGGSIVRLTHTAIVPPSPSPLSFLVLVVGVWPIFHR